MPNIDFYNQTAGLETDSTIATLALIWKLLALLFNTKEEDADEERRNMAESLWKNNKSEPKGLAHFSFYNNID